MLIEWFWREDAKLFASKRQNHVDFPRIAREVEETWRSTRRPHGPKFIVPKKNRLNWSIATCSPPAIPESKAAGPFHFFRNPNSKNRDVKIPSSHRDKPLLTPARRIFLGLVLPAQSRIRRPTSNDCLSFMCEYLRQLCCPERGRPGVAQRKSGNASRAVSS